MINEHKEKEIELRSEEFHDVLGSVPHWIVRYGILLLASIVVLILVCCSIIKYPDVISTSVILTGSEPTVSIVAKTAGQIKELLVADNQLILRGQYLAVIDNSASTSDVVELKKYITQFDLNNVESLPRKYNQLGSIQSSFSAFYMLVSEYLEFQRIEYHLTKIKFLNEKIKSYQYQLNKQIYQSEIVEKQLRLAEKKFMRDSILYVDQVIALQEFEYSNRELLQAVLSNENTKITTDNLKLQIMQLKESIFDAENQYSEKLNSFRNNFSSTTKQIENDIKNWEMTHVLISPIDGKIVFTKYWKTNQYLTAQDEVFSILPSNEIRLLGKALLPIARSGKVCVGQKVNVRFDNYPDTEFGKIIAVVQNISIVPMQVSDMTYYSVDIIFPNGLKTTYGQVLPFMPEMKGGADIITRDLTILERIILPLKKLLDNTIR